MKTEGPLSHLRVLDLSRLQPGAYVGQVLADLGADVLRVEQPGRGDATRWVPGSATAYHRGKRSMTLDLKHDDAPDVLRKLVAQVDVVLDSGLPSRMTAAGVDYGTLSGGQPGLVWCTIDGFGKGSPYTKRAAHDISFLGYSGMLTLMAGDQVPATPDFVMAVPYGALVAVIGILSALTERDRTGKGAFVDAAILDAATWVLGEAVARAATGDQPGFGQHANRRAYRTADGRMVTIAAAEPRTWAAFCEAVERPDLAGALATIFDEVEGAKMVTDLADLFAGRTAAEWEAALGDTEAAVGPVLTVEELLDDPHVEARGAIVELDDDTHTRTVRGPVRLRDAEGNERPFQPSPPPAIGEHTDEALAAAGFDAAAIAALHDRDAV